MKLLAASREVSFVIPSVSEKTLPRRQAGLADTSSNKLRDCRVEEFIPMNIGTPRNDTRRKRRGIPAYAGSLREINPHISKTVIQELEEVTSRLHIDKTDLRKIMSSLKITSTLLTKQLLIEEFGIYVYDEEDSHVVEGTFRSKCQFLLTHNMRHYKVNKIRTDLNITVLKPGHFLQYLRSRSKY